MRSGIGWVDFSSEHRDRVRSVIDLLATPGVVDELGVGVIRDAFADELFPGISTIQTRPKYLLIVPRILKDYANLPDRERKQVTVQEYLSEQEMLCRVKLCERYAGKDVRGIIGITFGTRTDRGVLRPPSSVYWNGLSQFGILRPDISIEEYGRRHSGKRLASSMLYEETTQLRSDDADAEDVGASPVSLLPEDANWQENLSITLGKEEAQFLCEKIGANLDDHLLGQIMRNPKAIEEVALLDDTAPFSHLLELPSIKNLKDQRLLRTIYLADSFWQLLFGAHVRYNLLLQDMYGDEAGQHELSGSWDAWLDGIQSFDWNAWNMDEVWQLVTKRGGHLHPWTRRFIDRWIGAVHDNVPAEKYDEIVRKQEYANKRSRARLHTKSTDIALNGWIGLRALAYRLPQVRTMALDIHRALSGEADPDAGL